MAKTEMRPIKDTIALEEARQLIAEACGAITRRERIPLLDANGRAAAVDVQVHTRHPGRRWRQQAIQPQITRPAKARSLFGQQFAQRHHPAAQRTLRRLSRHL